MKQIVLASYQGVFVDEYQDCSKEQHQMLMELSDSLPIRVLGDPLQGIFDFNGGLVDFADDLAEFTCFPPLEKPYRWINSDRADLGRSLGSIRELLENGKDIDLSDFSGSIEILIANEKEKFDPRKDYFKKLNSLQDEVSLLFIHPISVNKAPRLSLAKRFKRMTSIESIDDADFYNLSKSVDSIFDGRDKLTAIKDISYLLFNKTGLDDWFNNKGFKRKKNPHDKKIVDELLKLIDELDTVFKVEDIVAKLSDLRGVNSPRPEIYRSLLKALDIAGDKSLTAYEAMIEQRNKVRRSGRRVVGKHIGTTLLTKGLEFDVVVVLDAHKFDSPKHLYVALTRCCKRLIVVANNTVLSPYE